MDLSEKLIEEVQKRPALFDKTSSYYCNRVYLNKQWNEIGEKLKMDGQTARKKWTGLRDYFSRTHRHMTSFKSGSAPDKKRKWYLYDQMLFLLPYITKNKTSSYLSDLSDQEEGILGEESQLISPVPHDNDSKAALADITGPSSVEKNARTKVKFSQESALASTINKEILTAISNISSTASRSDLEDEDEHFFKSLIPKLKTLDPVTKWELQAEIQMLVLKYVKASGRQTPMSSSSSRPQYEGSGSDKFAHPPAHPQQEAHGSRTPSPIMPH